MQRKCLFYSQLLSYLTLKLRNTSIEINHAVFEILAESTDVQIIRRIIVDFPLTQRSR